MHSERRVAIFGLGYIGCVTAACLARLGHRVIGVDRDGFKVERIRNGFAPFYEPGLEKLVREGLAEGRLQATTDAREALQDAEIAMICVGTPSQRNGNQSLEHIFRVAREISRQLPAYGNPLTVAVRSTVFPGTCEEVVAPAFQTAPHVRIVSHPEFLREGSAVKDFMNPSLCVVGGTERAAVEQVAGLYAGLPVEPCLVTLRTAEMIKYACNAFHALKITFANEVGTICAQSGISGREVMQTLCRDETLNISSAYLKPGFPFGGSCLPKDLRALGFRAARLDLNLPLLAAVLSSNREHLHRATQTVLDLPAERIGFFGLTFKENTDDLRESPMVALLEQLIGKGRQVRVFDPQIDLTQIYGSNESFLLAAIPHIGRLLDKSLEETLRWAQYLVISQKPAAQHAAVIRGSGVPVLDLAGGEFVALDLKRTLAAAETA